MQNKRAITNADRLIDVTGYSADFLDALCTLIDDKHNPGWLFFIGSADRQTTLLNALKAARPDLDAKLWHASKPEHEKNSATIPFSLASEECAYQLVDLVSCKGKPQTEEGEPYRGKVKALILFSQQSQEQYLGHVLRCCQRLKAFRILDYLPNGEMRVCTEKQTGFEVVPVSVDFTKILPPEKLINAIPEAAMYGLCKNIAYQTHCPKGFAYIATVAASSVFVKPNCNIRPAIFAGLADNVHTGKSLACSRVFQLLGLEDYQGELISDKLVTTLPASDRGLQKIFPDESTGLPVSKLLYVDEGRAMMSKANIQGSSLISTLCELFNRGRSGVADKFGAARMNVRLSMLLCFKVKDAAEFPEIFTHATSHGLYDRFLFAVRGDEAWRYTAWELNEADVAEPDVDTPFDPDVDCVADAKPEFETSTPHVSRRIFEAVHEWASAGEDRDRLAEIALRVAYITSAVNKDGEVTQQALDAALCLMQWQEKIRAEFQPAKGRASLKTAHGQYWILFRGRMAITITSVS